MHTTEEARITINTRTKRIIRYREYYTAKKETVQ